MEILVISGIIILMVQIFDSHSTIGSLPNRVEIPENREHLIAG
tara:strand:- start:582 stop:710 length:129 start_codon:yes stop_codon:yes gene_type:complete